MAGRTPSELVDAATGGHHKKGMLIVSYDIFRDIFLYFAYLFYQFPLIGFILGFLGIFVLLKQNRTTAIFLLLLIVVNMFFFLSFGPGVKRTTKYTFYIADYTIFSIFIGCGFWALLTYLKNKGMSLKGLFVGGVAAVVFSPLALHNITPYASKIMDIDLLHARSIPYRNNKTFFLNPSKRGYTGAARYAEEALATARSDSVIIADHTPHAVLRYFQQVKGVRKDILLFGSGYHRQNIPQRIISKYYGKRDIYLADMEGGRYYRIRHLKDDYDFVPEGVLYRVIRKPTHAVKQKLP